MGFVVVVSGVRCFVVPNELVEMGVTFGCVPSDAKHIDGKKIPVCAGALLIITGICLIIGNLDELLSNGPKRNQCTVKQFSSSLGENVRGSTDEHLCTYQWTFDVDGRGTGVVLGVDMMTHHECSTTTYH